MDGGKRPADLARDPAKGLAKDLARDLALGLLLCFLILGLILFTSGESGADRGFIYVDF